MLPAMRWRISSRVGCSCAPTSATALTIWPGVQKPHCTASARTNASTIGWSRSPSIVVTAWPATRWASVMHESVGSPSTSTVQAPQWPSLHATFVPVRPMRSRRSSASDVPIGASIACAPPFTNTSGSDRHRLDVCEVHEARREAPGLRALRLGAQVGPRLPEVARRLEQLTDAVDLLGVAVALGAGVDREAEHAERVRLPRPQERRAHRDVLVDPRQLHRLRERGRTADGARRLGQLFAVG